MAAAVVAARSGLALDEFIAHFERQPFEIIDGVTVAMSPTVLGHDWLKQRVFLLIHDLVRAENLGYVFVETPFTVADPDDPSWVAGSLVPDMLFIAGQERMIAYKKAVPDWKRCPLEIVPDLIVEIQSPTDRNAAVLRKVVYALSLGVKAVWVFNEQRRSAGVYTPDSDPVTLHSDQTLDGGALLPGLVIRLADLFKDEE